MKLTSLRADGVTGEGPLPARSRAVWALISVAVHLIVLAILLLLPRPERESEPITFVPLDTGSGQLTFLGLPDRGLIKPSFRADIAVFDLTRLRDRATYQSPHQYSEGTIHVLVNGQFAIRDGKHTGILAGRPLLRGGKPFQR